MRDEELDQVRRIVCILVGAVIGVFVVPFLYLGESTLWFEMTTDHDFTPVLFAALAGGLCGLVLMRRRRIPRLLLGLLLGLAMNILLLPGLQPPPHRGRFTPVAGLALNVIHLAIVGVLGGICVDLCLVPPHWRSLRWPSHRDWLILVAIAIIVVAGAFLYALIPTTDWGDPPGHRTPNWYWMDW
jgi:hypothetical protein